MIFTGFPFIELTVNSSVYQSIPELNVRTSVRELTLASNWVMQQNKNPKHTSKSKTGWLKKKGMAQSNFRPQPDCNAVAGP